MVDKDVRLLYAFVTPTDRGNRAGADAAAEGAA